MEHHGIKISKKHNLTASHNFKEHHNPAKYQRYSIEFIRKLEDSDDFYENDITFVQLEKHIEHTVETINEHALLLNIAG